LPRVDYVEPVDRHRHGHALRQRVGQPQFVLHTVHRLHAPFDACGLLGNGTASDEHLNIERAGPRPVRVPFPEVGGAFVVLRSGADIRRESQA
jgi:hypothetical protein